MNKNDVIIKSFINSYTNNNLELFNYILDNHDICGSDLMDAIIYTTNYYRPKFFNILVENKTIDLNDIFSNNTTLIINIINCDFINGEEMIIKLLEKGVDINKQIYNGDTALFYTVKEDYLLPYFNSLISNGADINIKNHNGYTLLHQCAGNRNWNSNKIAKKLINMGIDENAIAKYNNTQFTAYDIATNRMNYELCNIIKN